MHLYVIYHQRLFTLSSVSVSARQHYDTTRAKEIWQKATSSALVDYLLSCRDAILGFIELEIVPFDPPTTETLP